MSFLYLFILAVISVTVIIIGNKSAMLRTEIFNEDKFCTNAHKEGIDKPRPAFSLGRTQLAFWTVIIASSFVFVLINNSTSKAIVVPVLDQVNMILLGIAAGTTVVAKIIDNSQKDDQSGDNAQQDYPSKNFLADIISDEKGVSIHRLQNVIWTIVVGGIYISYVSTSAKLPDSSVITEHLLELMGISTGAYLGLKTSENKAAPVDNPTPKAPAVTTPVTPPVLQPTVVTPAPDPAIADVSNSAQHDQ